MADAIPYKPSPVHLTQEDLADMQDAINKGQLPRDAIERHFEAEALNVFGHDAKKVKGEFVEQGIGSKGHETANHFAALLKAERVDRIEPPGSYEAAVREIWKRDPKRAEKLKLPRPESFKAA